MTTLARETRRVGQISARQNRAFPRQEGLVNRWNRSSLTDSSLNLAVIGLLSLILAGCKDSRISVIELHEREEQIAAKQEKIQIQPEKLALAEIQAYRVGPGDILTVALSGLPGESLSGGGAGGAGAGAAGSGIHVRVHPDGLISLPLVGQVQVAGMDLAGVEKAITAAYVPNIVKNLGVFVDIAGTETTTVLVRGAAGAPGLVSLKSNQRNVLYALAQSGGFGVGASGRVKIRPVRPDQQEITLDLTNPDDLRRALLHPPLQSGDSILVEPQITGAVYVLGLVNAHGAIPLPVGGQISVTRAIAATGGLRDFLDPKEATVWRTLPDGEQVRVKLSLAKIMDGKEPDFMLGAGDILEVPHTADTRVREWAMLNLRLGPFGVGAFYDPINVSTYKDRNDNRIGVGQSIQNSLIFGATNAVTQRVFNPVAQ